MWARLLLSNITKGFSYWLNGIFWQCRNLHLCGAFGDMNLFYSLIFGLVQTDRQTESNAYEPTMHGHRWAQQVKKICMPVNSAALQIGKNFKWNHLSRNSNSLMHASNLDISCIYESAQNIGRTFKKYEINRYKT